jgi:Ca2+-binding RTX toxin-like protein
VINGGRGRDTLTGGEGDDTLIGGSDKDTFVFSEISGTNNVITDYQDGVDKIGLDGYSFDDVTVANDAGSTLISTEDWSVVLDGIDFTLITEVDFVEIV